MKVNAKQLLVLLIAVAVFSLSELFPPWLYEDGWTSAKHSAGYHFLYSPPEVKSPGEMKRIFLLPDNEPPHHFSVRKDLLRLNIQRIALLFLSIGLLLFLGSRRSRAKAVLGSISIFLGCAFLGLFVWYLSLLVWY